MEKTVHISEDVLFFPLNEIQTSRKSEKSVYSIVDIHPLPNFLHLFIVTLRSVRIYYT